MDQIVRDIYGTKNKRSLQKAVLSQQVDNDGAKEAVSGLLPFDSEGKKIRRCLQADLELPFWFQMLPKENQRVAKDSTKDGPGLKRFADFLQHCYTAMHSIKYLEVLNDPEENQKMLRKLPNHLVSRWSQIVDKWIGEEREEGQGREALGSPNVVMGSPNVREAKYSPFKEFCQFFKMKPRIACSPITYLQTTKVEDLKGNRDKWKPHSKFPKNKDSKDSGFRSFETGADKIKEGRERDKEDNKAKRMIYLFCKSNLDIDTCHKFLCLPLTERRNFVKCSWQG